MEWSEKGSITTTPGNKLSIKHNKLIKTIEVPEM